MRRGAAPCGKAARGGGYGRGCPPPVGVSGAPPLGNFENLNVQVKIDIIITKFSSKNSIDFFSSTFFNHCYIK